MLAEKDFKKIQKFADELYCDLELEIIEEISMRIANVGYANTVVYNDVLILEEMGILYDDIIETVAKYNEVNVNKIRTIFEEAGIKTIKNDNKIYELAGITPKSISKEMQNLIKRRIDLTTENLKGLTRTIANTSQVQFIESVNKVYLETSTGVKSYSQAISDIVKEIGNKGVDVQYPSGAKRSIESAIRMNILTGINQMSAELQLEYGKKLGWSLYEVSAHSGARPEHMEWQGKVYTEKELYEKCGYGTITGLCGVNCRHTFYPYYKGSSKTYTARNLNDLKNEKVLYNGKFINKYDASQIQRRIERNIRQNKKNIAAIQGLLTSNSDDLEINMIKNELNTLENNLRKNNNILNNFTVQTGLKKDRSRLVI